MIFKNLKSTRKLNEEVTSSTDVLSTIEEGLADIKAGKMLIVIDDEDRENEGDLVLAADKVSTEAINFMITHGKDWSVRH